MVATPIGNLKDVSFRALATLAAADAVLAEDTRVTRTLLMHYGITTPLVAYHEHSNAAVRERMIARMQAGEALALVSDAGTPLVSDPGFKLVQAAIEAGLRVTPHPRRLGGDDRHRGRGPAHRPVLLRGLPAGEVRRAPQPPRGARPRSPAPWCCSSPPHRLPEMLADAAEVLGPTRPAAVARELTKLYETIRRGSLGELAALYAEEGAPKGEVVVIIGTQDGGPRRG